VFRTGRFDEKLYIGLPDLPARQGLLEKQINKIPRAPDLCVADWARRLEGYTGSDIVGILHDAKRAALSRSIRENNDPLLAAADLQAALQTIPSSVTEHLLKQYEAFRKQRFG